MITLHWLWLLLIFVAGGLIGITIMCLMFVAKKSDEVMIKTNYDRFNKKRQYIVDGLGTEEK